jgi:hypothetical protein
MGRPTIGLLGSFSTQVIQQIDAYRPDDIGWSGQTIAVELSLEPKLIGERLPSISSINNYLSKRGKRRRHNINSDLPNTPVVKAHYAHHVWQMDSEGSKPIKNVNWTCFINIKDVCKKTFVMSYPCCFKTASNHPKTFDYQRTLRLSFMEWGMPEHLQTDHESIFFDNKTKSPFPTALHLWLKGLNIELHFTPFGKPQKQGTVERSHQTMHRQVNTGRCFESEKELFDFTQQRRQRLNEHIPSGATQNLPPLVAHPDARFSNRHYNLQEEKDLFDVILIYNYLSLGQWFRRIAPNKTFSLGGKLYHLPHAESNSDIEIRFNRGNLTFDCFDSDGKFIDYVMAKGLDFNELSGDLIDFIKWADLQTLFKH